MHFYLIKKVIFIQKALKNLNYISLFINDFLTLLLLNGFLQVFILECCNYNIKIHIIFNNKYIVIA